MHVHNKRKKANHIMKGHRFVCLWVCVYPSPGRIVAPIVVIFGTRVLCRPGKVIGYQKILSLASLAHAAQKKRAAGLQQPVRLLYRSVWRREAPHTSKLMSRRRGVSRAASTRRRRVTRAPRARERSEQNECAKRTSSPAGLAGGSAKRAQRLVKYDDMVKTMK